MQVDGNLANVNLSDIFISVFTRKAKTKSDCLANCIILTNQIGDYNCLIGSSYHFCV